MSVPGIRPTDAAEPLLAERELGAVAAALANADGTSAAEPSRRSVARACRDRILAGGDPLGEAFCRIRTPQERRSQGATYTPPAIIGHMLRWAARHGTPSRVVDPGAGSGRFILAAARRFPEASLVAVETDPLAILILKANAETLGVSDRLAIEETDYRDLSLPTIDGTTAFVGNPPYVRHHLIDADRKDWLADTAAKHGLRASKLAGLHIHFFLKSLELARTGDYGAFITAAEWLDVNYGSVLRQALADGLGGLALHPIADHLSSQIM